MISKAVTQRDLLNSWANLNSIQFVKSVECTQVEKARAELQATFREERRGLTRALDKAGLSVSFRRMHEDEEYRLRKAFLRMGEVRRSRKEQLLFLIARMTIAERMAGALLKKLIRDCDSLSDIRRALSSTGIPRRDNSLLSLIEQVDRVHLAKGLCREIGNALDDYARYYDLTYIYAGAERDLYRHGSDVYAFEVDSAIERLLRTRTEASGAASLLIRSLLELTVRRAVFREDFPNGIRYVPVEKIGFVELLAACKRAGFSFNCSYDCIHRIWDNLNLIQHLGFRLPTSVLWVFYAVASGLRIFINPQTLQAGSGAKERARELALQVMVDLEKKGLVEALKPGRQAVGVTIYWRH